MGVPDSMMLWSLVLAIKEHMALAKSRFDFYGISNNRTHGISNKRLDGAEMLPLLRYIVLILASLNAGSGQYLSQPFLEVALDKTYSNLFNVAVARLCDEKSRVGLRIRRMDIMNKALAKQAWRIIKNQNWLIQETLAKKYCQREDSTMPSKTRQLIGVEKHHQLQRNDQAGVAWQRIN
ncbi:hypothetical protein J1N35_017554 [Gossypium stocksii]|uniref:Uncharacterized protein n=1 Tax=Gossypium stocksii TaxID=47602 RepID=A0A9D3VN87_9ROSI|nr:hypothetical protein J1N35_017554 [Gossypium stocksii]